MDLKKLIAKDPGIILSKSRTKALFNDAFRNEMAKVNVLMTAYEIGIVADMRKAHPLNTFEKNRLVKVMVQQHSIVENRANWAIETWASFFSVDIVQALEKVEAEEQAKAAQTVLLVDTSEMDEKPGMDSGLGMITIVITLTRR